MCSLSLGKCVQLSAGPPFFLSFKMLNSQRYFLYTQDTSIEPGARETPRSNSLRNRVWAVICIRHVVFRDGNFPTRVHLTGKGLDVTSMCILSLERKKQGP